MKRSWVLLAVLSFLLGVFAAAYWTSSTSSAVAAEPGAEEAAAGFEEATGMQPVTEPASAQPGTPSSLVDRQPQATQPAIGSAETATPAAPASQRAASYTPLTPSWTEPAPAKPAAASYTLETGSTLQVRTTNTLSTKVVEPGETFTASLEEAILDGGWGIAPKGALCWRLSSRSLCCLAVSTWRSGRTPTPPRPNRARRRTPPRLASAPALARSSERLQEAEAAPRKGRASVPERPAAWCWRRTARRPSFPASRL